MDEIYEAIAYVIKAAADDSSGLGGFGLLLAFAILVEGVTRIGVSVFRAIGSFGKRRSAKREDD